MRKLVVVLEGALCFVLLVMFRSFRKLERINPGFDQHGLLTFQVQGILDAKALARAAAVRQIQQQLKAMPGIQSVTGAAANGGRNWRPCWSA